jgi:hypothetical protein
MNEMNFDEYGQKAIEWFNKPNAKKEVEKAWKEAKKCSDEISKSMRFDYEKFKDIIIR